MAYQSLSRFRGIKLTPLSPKQEEERRLADRLHQIWEKHYSPGEMKVFAQQLRRRARLQDNQVSHPV